MLRRHLGFGLNLGAMALFFPGILLPMFALNMEMAATLSASSLSSPLIDKEMSIIATVQDLWADERVLVALLIFLFSVCIPLFKTTVVSAAYFQKCVEREARLVAWVSNIGKWSMADVFVVAIFLVILSTNHAETANNHDLNVFGLKFSLQISTQTLSAVGQGFYFFTAYCLVSLAGTQLYLSGSRKRARQLAEGTVTEAQEAPAPKS